MRERRRVLSGLLALAFVFGMHGVMAQGGGRFEDAAGWAGAFDSASRDEWQKPDEVIRALRLAPDMVVADIGAGTGYFSARLAKVLPAGRVYAVDMEPGMVAHLQQRVVREKLDNVRVIQATSAGPGLPEAVDLALLVNVQGLVVNSGDYFARLRRDLKSGGRVAIIATRVDATRGARREMRAPPEHVVAEMLRQGYVPDARHEFLEHQYFLMFRMQP